MSGHSAAAVLAAIDTNDGGAVEVVGESLLAQLGRARLTGRQPSPGERPDVIVDTTGDGEAIRRALARVADLGLVVLAGPPPSEPSEIDLYADLHVRGLTMIGVSTSDEEPW